MWWNLLVEGKGSGRSGRAPRMTNEDLRLWRGYESVRIVMAFSVLLG